MRVSTRVESTRGTTTSIGTTIKPPRGGRRVLRSRTPHRLRKDRPRGRTDGASLSEMHDENCISRGLAGEANSLVDCRRHLSQLHWNLAGHRGYARAPNTYYAEPGTRIKRKNDFDICGCTSLRLKGFPVVSSKINYSKKRIGASASLHLQTSTKKLTSHVGDVCFLFLRRTRYCNCCDSPKRRAILNGLPRVRTTHL